MDLTPLLSPTITANSAYASGNSVGGKFTIALPNVPALLQNVTVVDKDAQSAALSILFFDTDPTASSPTDKTAFTTAAADLPNLVGHVNIAAADYTTVGGAQVATVKPGTFVLAGNGASRNLFAVIVLASGTPTWTATTGKLNVRLGFIRA